MIILALKTDQPEAELWLYDGQKKLVHKKWLANRELTTTLHHEIAKILDKSQGASLDLSSEAGKIATRKRYKSSISLGQVGGIVCYQGPGSFTGLRIGLSVANALTYSQDITIVATSGPSWLERGISELLEGKNDQLALPKYGSPAATTKPKK